MHSLPAPPGELPGLRQGASSWLRAGGSSGWPVGHALLKPGRRGLFGAS